MVDSIGKLMKSYNGPNESYFTFVMGGTTTGRLVYYTWEGKRVNWTNEITGEQQSVKYLKQIKPGKDEGRKNYRLYVLLFDEKGNLKKQQKRTVLLTQGMVKKKKE